MQDEASHELFGTWVDNFIFNAHVTKKDASYTLQRLFDNKVE